MTNHSNFCIKATFNMSSSSLPWNYHKNTKTPCIQRKRTTNPLTRGHICISYVPRISIVIQWRKMHPLNFWFFPVQARARRVTNSGEDQSRIRHDGKRGRSAWKNDTNTLCASVHSCGERWWDGRDHRKGNGSIAMSEWIAPRRAGGKKQTKPSPAVNGRPIMSLFFFWLTLHLTLLGSL